MVFPGFLVKFYGLSCDNLGWMVVGCWTAALKVCIHALIVCIYAIQNSKFWKYFRIARCDDEFHCSLCQEPATKTK